MTVTGSAGAPPSGAAGGSTAVTGMGSGTAPGAPGGTNTVVVPGGQGPVAVTTTIIAGGSTVTVTLTPTGSPQTGIPVPVAPAGSSTLVVPGGQGPVAITSTIVVSGSTVTITVGPTGSVPVGTSAPVAPMGSNTAVLPAGQAPAVSITTIIAGGSTVTVTLVPTGTPPPGTPGVVPNYTPGLNPTAPPTVTVAILVISAPSGTSVLLLEKVKAEERRKQEAEETEMLIEQNQPRKRKAPMDESREQRAAKKRARELTTEAAMGGESDEESDTGRDPRRALGEKECRLLINAYERWGAFDERPNEIIKPARLIGRDVETVKTTLQDIVDTADRLLREEDGRQATLERETNKAVTKKDKKAVLFDFRGVKRNNAERPREMRMIRDEVERAPDWRNFRVPEASKPAMYTVEWGAKQDGMLIVGMARHGFGAWVEIRDDPELELHDKLYLEEHRVAAKEERTKGGEAFQAKSPGAVHLVRRANYLLSVLKDKLSNGTNIAARRALDNHHRNRKSLGPGRPGTPSHASGSPAPGKLRHSESDSRRMHQSDMRNSLDGRRHAPQGSPNGLLKHHYSEERRSGHHRNGSSPNNSRVHAQMNGDGKPFSEADRKIEAFLKPIDDRLQPLHTASRKNIPDDDKRLKIIKQGILAIGNHINTKASEYGVQDKRDQIWEFVSRHHWPQSKVETKRVEGSKLRDMFKKLGGKDTTGTKVAPKPEKPNGPPTPASATTNGAASVVKSEVVVETAPVVKSEAVVKTAPAVKSEVVDEPVAAAATQVPEQPGVKKVSPAPEVKPAIEVGQSN
ncbi:ATP-dependent DNA helicase Hrp3 [Friedmanniomyces endolithicus]|uniref:ATP-dependent DNA helicase Hrp3 n=1 Tax=Friedmanniomyces endolithicus TaxID=329885 RepID=A0AAN6FBF6_9PEZI|nr:ATP-dependent DNA helicase Hrp3 [Friedmanniomyces endolithicus]